MYVIFQLAFGWLYGHFFEYAAHRYVLHNYKRFKPAFKNHFKKHHGISRKNNMYDAAYENMFSCKFEVSSLASISLLHSPLIFYLPYTYFALICSMFMYYILHKRAHTDVAWGKKWLPWHYAHHMGKNQNINWGVRLPIIDKMIGTSEY